MIKISEIKIQVLGKDKNRSYTLEPDEEIKTIDEAVDYLVSLDQSGDFEKKDEIPF